MSATLSIDRLNDQVKSYANKCAMVAYVKFFHRYQETTSLGVWASEAIIDGPDGPGQFSVRTIIRDLSIAPLPEMGDDV